MPEKNECDEAERNEAICFTAGPQGAAFGAGIIHAWLAFDRPDPRVVAGISTGAVTAAAMQRAIFERGQPGCRTEATRWEWFQKYLTDILDRPLDVIWKAFPDPVDFLSATTPVRDLSCPEVLQEEEQRSRYHFWILTKLGNWIAGLPITIGELGTLAVLKVRHDERVPLPLLGGGAVSRAWRLSLYILQCVRVASQVAASIIFRPMFTRTYERFESDEKEARGGGKSLTFPGIRPLFGWYVWLVTSLVAVIAFAYFAIIVATAGRAAFDFYSGGLRAASLAALSAIALMLVASAFLLRLFRRPSFQDELNATAARMDPNDGSLSPAKHTTFDKFLDSLMKSCCINLHIIHNYQMKRRIWNRFSTASEPVPKIRCDEQTGTNLVIVASALQPLAGMNHQCWAHSGTPLVDALAAACAIQPMFPPTHIEGDRIGQWLRKKEMSSFCGTDGKFNKGLDLVDGAVVRRNPLPALFNWLQDHPDIAATLRSTSPADARIHVIYNVPMEPFDAYEGKAKPDRIDLLEAADVGILMRARRDTSIEVDQTNFLSGILNAEQTLSGTTQKLLSIFADELAPARELKFDNALSPSREEGLTVAAEGCRRTLGRLYEDTIVQKGVNSHGFMACSELRRRVAPARQSIAGACGLPEVCSRCTGQIAPYSTPSRSPAILKKTFGGGSAYDLRKELPHLCTTTNPRPRIVFVASGGVFRGAFHIGLLGAMQALDLTPDLVVGASVGTLMGGALAAMRFSDDPVLQRDMLAELARTFIHVDETVALTVPVKSAVKRLGLRARKLKLSPASLRAAVRAGTASDVGYASTGVPPIVIDTLSELFIIPPAETIKAGTDFLAGRFAKAASTLAGLIRVNTLDSLGIRYAVIGTSLLEGAARKLMGASICGVDLDQRQPYIPKGWKEGRKATAIFCTTAYVNQRWPLLLGRDALTNAAPYFRFVYAALSSSAFPAAFPARHEAEVFPGTGAETNLFCDGGMFDNLPFIPAIELLRETQAIRFNDSKQTPKQFLLNRLKAPDLIISGGFDPLPSDGSAQVFTSRSDINARTGALGAAVKTDSFISMSRRVSAELHKLAEAAPDKGTLHANVVEAMTCSIVAGVVNIVPATKLHLNPTFGFARSLGFAPERVSASIADGCFQTLRGLEQERWPADSDVQKSLTALNIRVQRRRGEMSKCDCPYFDVQCAFAQAAEDVPKESNTPARAKADDCRQVYRTCCADPVHRKLSTIKAG